MDKTAIKNYAVAARRKLIDAVRQKAYQLYIREGMALPLEEAKSALMNDGIFLTNGQYKSRERLVSEISRRVDELGKEKGYNAVMEEIAYTWFNRLIALRFMEVNDYLPSGIRILSSVDEGRAEPDVIREADRLDYVDQGKIAEYRDLSSQKLYKYILISQCNALSSVLPGMFEKIDDYTELLLPDALYAKGGIVHDLAHGIAEEDFRDQVQIIGWLYQYYISEKKDEVFAGLKKNIKINKETIPAATQLFTPEWIVRYMVENSLGRVVVSSGQWAVDSVEALKSNWKYYIEEAEQTDEARQQLLTAHCSLSTDFHIENVKIIDPCMGSGHILVYAFDVLYQIYFSQGYAEREIPNLILQNNIYGLDIDKRAAQLAYFALMMKARSYNRRFFRQQNIPDPHVHAVIESDGAQLHHLEYMGHGMDETGRRQCRDDLSYLIGLFADAREYGSILKIDRVLDYARLRRFVKDCRYGQLDMYTKGIDQTERILLEILDIAEIMTQKYDVVVTNPPYMGGSGMGPKLSEYVKKNYPDSKSDMSTVFMERTLDICKSNGFMAMINIPVWMFLSSYERLREKLLKSNTIVNMLHFGRGVFGSDFGTTAFIVEKAYVTGYKTIYRKLYLKQGAVDSLEQKEKWFFSNIGKYIVTQENYERIPGLPIAYELSEKALLPFTKNPVLKDIASPKAGLATGDNISFQRNWFEVAVFSIGFNYTDVNETQSGQHKWFPCNSGGEFRKWATNNELVVDWQYDGKRIRSFINPAGKLAARPQNTRYYFKRGLTWNKISASKFAVKYKDSGSIFDDTSRSAFVEDESKLLYIIGFLCSNVCFEYLRILNPSMSFTNSDLERLPIVFSQEHFEIINDLVAQNIDISRTDWDSFETSWDFRVHPLVGLKIADVFAWGDIKSSSRISSAFNAWELFSEGQFEKLKSNEEELNRIFIEIYGLQDELTPEVEDKDVTIRRADLSRDIRSFISYAVGCMFGRYSLDEPGLKFAGGEFSEQWAVVSGQYYLKEVLREYGCAELPGTDRLAKGNATGESGGAGKDIDKRIRAIPVDSAGLQSGTSDTPADMRRTRIPCRYGYKASDGIVGGSGQNAGCPYKETAHCPLTTDHYGVESDAVIPIGANDYFDDDIVVRFVDFVRVVYGEDTLQENLDFIADALYPNGNGTAREKIRRYFLNDFYKDHVKTYKKKPIYWLFDSGRQNGFKALVYLHRYDKFTVARVRTDYLHPLQRKYESEIGRLQMLTGITENAGEKAAYRKEIEALQKKIEECRVYDQVVAHIAHQAIELDLDDGVKVNYAKFQGVEVPKDNGKTVKMDLLAKI
ncbi:BREX-1 system adenine-specific DNA-methyltransferase PglX [Pelotomaculum terephthalicicum JT]|uniref:BREX-1 system adenine-specific DNA-methyltransferase PglX n=1 Tax=Pelotomaculum terephthalicicum TaxID=206393 RepID=UPI001F042E62|nr:BREX-1 system adenine-specific DNA-methyltransferase PglX [Pelotomaculum terephthalicicum]MCG9969223.1 BREX-1 system adenine-specific DNA-methyltransferase PglX [Pelotomaculum terephthalicicum JT]